MSFRFFLLLLFCVFLLGLVTELDDLSPELSEFAHSLVDIFIDLVRIRVRSILTVRRYELAVVFDEPQLLDQLPRVGEMTFLAFRLDQLDGHVVLRDDGGCVALVNPVRDTRDVLLLRHFAPVVVRLLLGVAIRINLLSLGRVCTLALALVIIFITIPATRVVSLLLSTLLRPTAVFPALLLSIPAGLLLLPTACRRGIRTPRLLRWALRPLPLLATAFGFLAFDIMVGPTVVPVARSVLSVISPRADRRIRCWLAALRVVRCLRPCLLLLLQPFLTLLLALLEANLVLFSVHFTNHLSPIVLLHMEIIEVHHPHLALSRHCNHVGIHVQTVAELEPGRLVSINIHRHHRLVERRSGRCNSFSAFTLDPMHQPEARNPRITDGLVLVER